MSRLTVAAFAAVALAAPVARALPPTPLTTYSTSPNVHFLMNVPTGVGVGGKFSGHYYFHTTARSTSYAGPTEPQRGAYDGASDGGLWVFDVAQPETPVLAAHVPLPIWQNEDVDLSAKRKILLVAADRQRVDTPDGRFKRVNGTLFVYDIAVPNAPVLKSVLPLPPGTVNSYDGSPGASAGHIANCVLDCTYVYLTGSLDRSVLVVDLRDPAAPKVVGNVATPAGADSPYYAPGVVHDVNTDQFGNVWMTGSGGTAMYAPVKDPLRPVLLASTSRRDNARTDNLIHHNSMRLDRSTVLVGEEAYTGCGDDTVKGQGGRFQTWHIDLKAKRLVPLALWQKAIPGVPSCSGHWFDVNPHHVVADTFYEGGLRFLDVTNPRRVRQVGWFRTSDGVAGQAQYVPGRPDLVYVSDYLRGLDVVRVDGGGRGARTASEGHSTAAPRSVRVDFVADERFGYACPLVRSRAR
jgi:hypothetical protein